jgi:UDP-glucose 4-epimerase
MEGMLHWYGMAYGIRSIALRYFNAAGADPEGELGEDHRPEEHLIPLVLFTAMGKRDAIAVFGTDYDTPDGTCIRDYIHVADLCEAHYLALQRLRAGASSTVYNLGNGQGYSVLEVIRAAEEVVSKPIPVRYAPRRAGDPERLVASAEKARRELGWQPRYPELATMIEHAYRWFLRHPDGYG